VQSGQPESVRVQVVCLTDAEARGRLDLATIGANARRAVEDSRTVAYIGDPTPAATRFSAPILEEAGIAQLSGSSGAAAMSRVLRAIDAAGDSGSPRESLHDELG
jgi:ABC-type branched-subunit amino acid transport system substrate-binding protein